MNWPAQESEGSGSASSNRPSGSAGPLALAAPRSCSWPDRMSKYLRMTAPGNWTALTEREPSELKDSATASPGSRTGGAGLRQVEGEDGVLGVDGDHGDARPRARFGGDGVHIQVTPTVRPRCHGQFPLFCSFPRLQILYGFQIDLVDLNTPRPKNPRFPNSSTKFRLLRPGWQKSA